MEDDLLELVSSLILKNELYDKKIEKLEFKYRELQILNSELIDKIRTLELLLRSIESNLYKFEYERNRTLPINIFDKNYFL